MLRAIVFLLPRFSSVFLINVWSVKKYVNSRSNTMAIKTVGRALVVLHIPRYFFSM